MLEETGVTTLFGTSSDLIKIAKLPNTSDITTLVCFDGITEELRDTSKDFTLLDYWTEVKSEAIKGHQVIPPMIPPTRDSIFTLSYTSGTTGRPKGAMISNGNMLSGLRNLAHVAPL